MGSLGGWGWGGGSDLGLAQLSYAQRVLATQPDSLIGYWPLSEASGTTITDLSSQANNGAYKATGVTLGQTGMGDGRTCPLFASGYGNVQSAGLVADFNGQSGTLMAWGRVSGAGVWADGTLRYLVGLTVNANNRLFLNKAIAANTLNWRYIANTTAETVSDASLGATTDWFHMALTWDYTNDEVRCYLNGVAVGAAQNGVGAWAGDLTASVIAASSVTTGNPWDGYVAHVALWDTPLTPAEIADLAQVGGGMVYLNTRVVRVTDSGGAPTPTAAELYASTFGSGSIHTVIAESSGYMGLSGDVVEAVLGRELVGDDTTEAGRAALVTELGVSEAGFDKVIYVLRENAPPLWNGTYDSGGVRIWTKRGDKPRVACHELGHTLNLYHSGVTGDEYGDQSDTMGGGIDVALTRYHAVHLWQKGWLGGTLTTGAIGNTYTLVATESASPVVVRIPTGETNEYYWLSLRVGTGLDANLGADYLNKVSVHKFGVAYDPDTTLLLDTLAATESYADAVMTITVTAISGDTATVTVAGP